MTLRALLFCDRPTVERMAPVVNAHFQRWGMDVHEKKPSDTKVKTIVLFCAAPPSVYDDPTTFDGADLSDFTLPNGNVIPVVDKAKYLGSIVSRDCTDDVDVSARVLAASKAFGALGDCLFRSDSVSVAAKREAYVALVMAVLIYGCECWNLTGGLWAKLKKFHHASARAMCRISMWHTQAFSITTASVLQLLKLRHIETYVIRRQLQWAGHIARMGPERLPRKFLTSWCYNARPQARPDFTFGEGLEEALRYAGVEVSSWMTAAQNRKGWREIIMAISDKAEAEEPHPVLRQRAEVAKNKSNQSSE